MDMTLAHMKRYCDGCKEVRIWTDYDAYLKNREPEAILGRYDDVPTPYNKEVRSWRVDSVDDIGESIICVVV